MLYQVYKKYSSVKTYVQCSLEACHFGGCPAVFSTASCGVLRCSVVFCGVLRCSAVFRHTPVEQWSDSYGRPFLPHSQISTTHTIHVRPKSCHARNPKFTPEMQISRRTGWAKKVNLLNFCNNFCLLTTNYHIFGTYSPPKNGLCNYTTL